MASPEVVQRNKQFMNSLALGETWVINSTTVNEFRAQVAFYKHTDVNGVSCLDLAACVPARLSFPSVNSTAPTFAQPTWWNQELKVEFINNLSKQWGNHAFKVGVDYTLLPRFNAVYLSGSPGNVTFFDDPSTIVNNTTGRYPQGFQTPGIVRSITQSSLERIHQLVRPGVQFRVVRAGRLEGHAGLHPESGDSLRPREHDE